MVRKPLMPVRGMQGSLRAFHYLRPTYLSRRLGFRRLNCPNPWRRFADTTCPQALVRKEHRSRQDPHQDPRLTIEHIGNRKGFQPGKVIRNNEATAPGKLRAQAMQAKAHAHMPLQATQKPSRERMVPLID